MARQMFLKGRSAPSLTSARQSAMRKRFAVILQPNFGRFTLAVRQPDQLCTSFSRKIGMRPFELCCALLLGQCECARCRDVCGNTNYGHSVDAWCGAGTRASFKINTRGHANTERREKQKHSKHCPASASIIRSTTIHSWRQRQTRHRSSDRIKALRWLRASSSSRSRFLLRSVTMLLKS